MQKVSLNIGEELVKPAAVAMVKTIGGADIAKKVESVPLSDNSIKRYFPENVDLKKHSWIRNVFSVNVSEVGEDIPGFQEELIDLQENQVQKQHFENLSIAKFWTQLKDKPILTREAEKALLPFPTTYLCEQGFSSLVTIKTKARNRLDPST
ncbi:protein FAM200A-like [Penaeus japonicus]|uniref:protein FAM200A-like n=1 Tax=Penaeus japonicus TaxID=27405 RepID=UPI001C71583F|nr:protein FAM200A-like [Penaeus japonicus]XP_042891609.1 protein FAM200A-like [Penaeus japonicus]